MLCTQIATAYLLYALLRLQLQPATHAQLPETTYFCKLMPMHCTFEGATLLRSHAVVTCDQRSIKEEKN